MTATPTTNLSYQNFFSATLSSDITATSTDIFLDAIPNGSEGFLVIDPDNEDDREVIYYTSKTALKVVCPSVADGRGQDDTTATSHLTGTTVIMAPIAAYFEALQTLFTTSPQGWTSVSGAISAVTNNGNRAYDLTTATDQTAVLSPGMRLRTTRTVAAPTQCTDLEAGSSQYYSKTSPNKLTFTDDFTCMGWIKMESYARGGIIARRNADTEGFSLSVNATGQLEMAALRIAGNNAVVTSYQSVPLGRWVHVAATYDLSGTTAAVYFDGVEVPSFKTVTGTCTALVQGTTALVVGAEKSAGTNPFDGKIAQAAVFSAVLSASTIRSYMSQGLSGTETNICSAYSFNNSIADLNTTTPNDLTAQGSAVATNADSPFGGQADGTISSTLDYGIIAKVTASTVTVNVAEGCTIPTSGGVASASYSTYREPYGFPGSASKWQLMTQTINRVTKASPTGGSSYNTGIQLTIPVGQWSAGYRATAYVSNSTSATLAVYTDLDPTAVTGPWAASGTVDRLGRFASSTYVNAVTEIGPSHYVRMPLNVTTTTQYWLNCQPTASGGTLSAVGFLSDFTPAIVFADNAYL